MTSFEEDGVLILDDLSSLPSEKQLMKGVAITECIQYIPCDPCVDSCPVHAISMKDVNALPVVDYDQCIACGKCVGICPGLAIFVIKKQDEGKGLVTLPYEFLPVPKKNDIVETINRYGERVGTGMVKRVIKQGRTMVVTIEVSADDIMNVRHIKVGESSEE